MSLAKLNAVITPSDGEGKPTALPAWVKVRTIQYKRIPAVTSLSNLCC